MSEYDGGVFCFNEVYMTVLYSCIVLMDLSHVDDVGLIMNLYLCVLMMIQTDLWYKPVGGWSKVHFLFIDF